jgi:acyl carrier protein
VNRPAPMPIETLEQRDLAIRTAIAEALGQHIDDVTRAASFKALGADSLDMIEISLDVEAVLGVDLEPVFDDPFFDTVGDAIDAIEKAVHGVGEMPF